MTDQSPNPLQQRVSRLVTEALEQSNPSAWFEPLYAAAQGDTAQIPWAKLAPQPYLQHWLQQHPGWGMGKAALVVGCGLGDDAEALAGAGFAVTAFDISPTAIAWCRDRFPTSPVHYQVADLLNLETAWHQRFDLVFECRNVQALPLSVRQEAIAAVAGLVAPQGRLLVVTHLRAHGTIPAGPPWPLSDDELTQFLAEGLRELQRQSLVKEPSVEIVGIEYDRPE